MARVEIAYVGEGDRGSYVLQPFEERYAVFGSEEGISTFDFFFSFLFLCRFWVSFYFLFLSFVYVCFYFFFVYTAETRLLSKAVIYGTHN